MHLCYCAAPVQNAESIQEGEDKACCSHTEFYLPDQSDKPPAKSLVQSAMPMLPDFWRLVVVTVQGDLSHRWTRFLSSA